MKNKKKTLIGLVLLVAVVMLGIGYAASSQKLTINGTATAKSGLDDFSVVFSDVTVPEDTTTTSATATINESNKTTASVNVSLTKPNESVTVTFKIKNESPTGIDAVITEENIKVLKGTEEFTSNYFTVTVDKTKALEIPSQQTVELPVTITLNKAYVPTDGNDTYSENFTIALDSYTAKASN